mgnify:CR=1 FL=1
MLGKLFKYEFKNTYKLMFIIYGVMAFVTILGCIAMYLVIKRGAQVGEINAGFHGNVGEFHIRRIRKA